MQSPVYLWHFTTDSPRHAPSLHAVLLPHGSPPAHGGTPAHRGGNPTSNLWPSTLVRFPQEKAAKEGSPAHAAALQLSRCRRSLCGASADPSPGLPCSGEPVVQVSLSPCHHCLPIHWEQPFLDGEQQAEIPATHRKGDGRLSARHVQPPARGQGTVTVGAQAHCGDSVTPVLYLSISTARRYSTSASIPSRRG